MNDKLIDIMALISAIHNTAKRYHWQCEGPNFYESHLFFDRIADIFNQEVVDTLAEAWYMNNGRDNIVELNLLDALIAEKVGKQFIREELHSSEITLEMLKQLAAMIAILLEKIKTEAYGQGVSNKLDELAQSSSQILGLIKARLQDSQINRVTARLTRNKA